MTADLAIKEPCRVVTSDNITLAGLQTIDGVALTAGDRILVRAQTSALDNGIWLAATGAWQRADDFDEGAEVRGGCEVIVTSGDTNAGSRWRLSGHGSLQIGEAPIAFAAVPDGASLGGPGGAAQIGSTGPSNVQADLNARPTSATLAAGDGSSLIGYRRHGAPAVQRLLSSRNDEILYAKDYMGDASPVGEYYDDAIEGLRDLHTYAPDKAVVRFSHGGDLGGTFALTDTWTITKHLRIDGGGARIVGKANVATKDLIVFRPDLEFRNGFVRDLKMDFNGAGRNTLVIGNFYTGILQWEVSGNWMVGGSSGWALTFEGIGTHFNTVRDNYIVSGGSGEMGAPLRMPTVGGLRLACADRMSVYNNGFSGPGCSILIDLIVGAYRTRIGPNGYVNKDGGVFVARGSKIDIVGGTFEQATYGADSNNASFYKAMVTVLGQEIGTCEFTGRVANGVLTVTSVTSGALAVGGALWGSSSDLQAHNHVRIIGLGTGTGGVGTYLLNDHRAVIGEVGTEVAMSALFERPHAVRIMGNNFNPGTRADTSVCLAAFTDMAVVDDNDFNTLGNSGADVQLFGPTNRFNRVGDRNRVGGVRDGSGGRGDANTLDPKRLLKVSDTALGTYGHAARKGGGALGLTGGWEGSTLEAWKGEDDLVRFTGALINDASTPDSNGAGYLVATLPDGLRPAENFRLAVLNSSDTMSLFNVYTSGEIRCHAGVVYLGTHWMQNVQFPVRGASSYLSPAY